MKKRFSIVPAVYGVLHFKNEILFALRTNTSYMDGFYGFPAGHVEKDESLKEALIRELKEEVGLEAKSDDIQFRTMMYRKAETRTSLDVFFDVKISKKELLKNKEPEKCKHLKWFKEDSMPTNVIPYVKEILSSSNELIESGFSE